MNDNDKSCWNCNHAQVCEAHKQSIKLFKQDHGTMVVCFGNSPPSILNEMMELMGSKCQKYQPIT